MFLKSVLLTGATGNVGAVLIEQLLDAGVTVDAVLRSFAKSKKFLEQKYQDKVASGQLRFTEIADMGVEGAFDAPTEKVSAIIHVATPLSTSNFLETLIKPIYRINENVLRAADRSPTVKRVIITGSIVSVVKLPEDMGKDVTFNEENYNSITLEEAVTSFPAAYQYSKTSSEQKAWEYMAKGSHSFDLVFLLAPSILGRSIQQGYNATKDDLGGISSIYRDLFDVEVTGSVFPYVMDVDDVARTHVKSLEVSSVLGNKRYLLVGDKISAAEVVNKIRAKYPALQSRVPAPEKEETVSNEGAKFDSSRADKVFGTSWVSGWDSIVAVVDDILAYDAAHPEVL